jgi:uncharacterized coiled-coil protein SlyX
MADERGDRDELERRLTDLEIRYTHQEETLRQLSEVIYQQERVMEALTKRMGACEAVAAGDTSDGMPG